MEKIRKETLYSILEEFHGCPSLKGSIDELLDPQMGIITGFQDMVDSINELKSADLDDYSPF